MRSARIVGREQGERESYHRGINCISRYQVLSLVAECGKASSTSLNLPT